MALVKDVEVAGNESEMSELLRKRCAAFLVDYILMLLVPTATLVLGVWIRRHWPLARVPQLLATPGFVAMAAAALLSTLASRLTVSMVVTPLSILGYLVTAGVIFWNWVEVYVRGWQSLGKQFFGLRIRSLNGGPISHVAALKRHLLGYPLMLLGFGVLKIVRDPRSQGWHDQLAGTMVESNPQPEYGRQTRDGNDSEG